MVLNKEFKEFIELLNENKDLKFEDCYKAKVDVEIQGLHIDFIDI